MILRFSALLLSLWITGCATTGLTYNNFLKVQKGMTQEEVLAILGEPTDVTSASVGTGGIGSIFGIDDVSGTNMIWMIDGVKANVIFFKNKVISSNYSSQF